MKKNNKKDELLNLVQDAGEKYGFLNLFKKILEGAKKGYFGEDLETKDVIDTIFETKNGNLVYLEREDVENIFSEIKESLSEDELTSTVENLGYGIVKLDSLADETRFESAMEVFIKNPYCSNLQLAFS